MRAPFPEALRFLFTPSRYKIAFGGRGSAKSWSCARALLLIGADPGLLWPGRTDAVRILCGRETQKSISDSVHKLLSDQIKALEFDSFYRVQQSTIEGANGTQFLFAGLKHNISNLKSTESVDIAWIEEAQGVSHNSWEVLIPSIRKEKSEIWASLNPDLESDATYQRFIVDPPPGAIVRKVNYTDNPWFPDVLKAEMELLKERDRDAYEHVWMGSCISVLAGAIYADELRALDRENRVTRVLYDRTRPVDTYWDLGWGDCTSIFFAQSFPFEYRVIDFLENSRKPLSWYIGELQRRGYVYGTHYLPHDARAHQLGSGRSVEELMREAGLRVRIVEQLRVADGINAAREIFPQCWFDGEKCRDGLQHLRHYKYGENKAIGGPTREPLHDEHSHAADAFRVMGVAMKPPAKEGPRNAIELPYYGESGWMA